MLLMNSQTLFGLIALKEVHQCQSKAGGITLTLETEVNNERNVDENTP